MNDDAFKLSVSEAAKVNDPALIAINNVRDMKDTLKTSHFKLASDEGIRIDYTVTFYVDEFATIDESSDSLQALVNNGEFIKILQVNSAKYSPPSNFIEANSTDIKSITGTTVISNPSARNDLNAGIIAAAVVVPIVCILLILMVTFKKYIYTCIK